MQKFYRKKTLIALLGILVWLAAGTNAEAQNMTVKGKILDSDGIPLAGVAVVLKGAPTKGVQSGESGDYQIADVPKGGTLVYTYIGFASVEKEIKESTINVIMVESTAELGEVTVVAFGKQKTASVVASIETVRVSDLKVPASNLTTALAGRVPGLISYQTSGEPGQDNAQFFVRGVTTFGYKTDPLILIDGFESTTTELARMTPDDIESFSVLKDASATVLYGSRAANGIIIVTTKGGHEGKLKVNIRVDNHIATPTKVPETVDGVTYMKMYNEARITRNPLMGSYYDAQKIRATEQGLNPMIYPNENWYDNLFHKSTMNTKAHIDVSGGGQVATYYVAGGFDHETGLLRTDQQHNYDNNININRFNLRTNVIFKLAKGTNLDARITGRFEKYTGPHKSASDIFGSIMVANPVDFPAVYNPDPTMTYVQNILFGNTFSESGSLKQNPYAEMVRGYTNRDESDVMAMLSLQQDMGFLTEGLKLELKGSVNPWTKYSQTRSYTPFYYSLDSYDQVSDEYRLWCLNPTSGQLRLGDIDPGRDASFKYYFEGRATWSRAFDKHNLTGMVVGTFQESLVTGGNTKSIYEALPERNSGLSGRFSYDFDTRYFFEVAFGYNGSEKFSGLKRWGFFPSVAGGWLVSNEAFWESMKNTVSTLKLKGSYGVVGNDYIAELKNRFFFLSDITTSGDVIKDGYRWGERFTTATGGFRVNRYANPDISWETSYKWNLGLEIGMLKDALKIQVEPFGEDRRNIYMMRENFPATAGAEATINGNVGRVKSWGVDGSLDFKYSFTNDLWTLGRANFTYADNEYIELDEKNYIDRYRSRMGHNVNQQFGYVAQRLFVDETEIANSPHQDFGVYQAGDIKYEDVNGDGVINENDQIPLGFPTVPKIQYGFGATVGYKEFDFSFFFQGNALVSFFINPKSSDDGIVPLINRRNALKIVADSYWTETNPDVNAFWPRLSVTEMNNNIQQSTWWLRNGAFMRLKSVELGWTPKIFQNKLVKGVQSLRVYASGENLAVISGFNLWDPEMGSKGMGYPPNKRFNVGLLLGF